MVGFYRNIAQHTIGRSVERFVMSMFRSLVATSDKMNIVFLFL